MKLVEVSVLNSNVEFSNALVCMTENVTLVALYWHKAKNNLFHKYFVELYDVPMLDQKVLKLYETGISFVFSFRWNGAHFKDGKKTRNFYYFSNIVKNIILRIAGQSFMDLVLTLLYPKQV